MLNIAVEWILVAPLLTSVTLVVVSIHDDNDYTVHISDSCSPTVVAAAGVSLAATSCTPHSRLFLTSYATLPLVVPRP
ncbi:hypothetical protein PMALA_051070 [Plasmodium malariae]|uniref:Uncharacterized protein n=1 Tax=Plasmodium malariae TaxID=5858 RepID=A0A1A8WT02_PLAMA|nr:hypothetical protein PMALA_051070 [Plasmodium malariae]